MSAAIPIDVHLTEEEVFAAVSVGSRREVKNISGRVPDLSLRAGVRRDGFTQQIYGAIGELAVAKHLGLYWSGVADSALDRAPDVFPNIEVRWTSGSRFYCKGRDPNQSQHGRCRIVWVSTREGMVNPVQLLGWQFVSECKRAEWRRPDFHGSVFEVPFSNILPMTEWSNHQNSPADGAAYA